MSERSLVLRWAARIESWPRWLRIVLTMLVSASLVMLVWLLLAESVGGGVTNANPSPALTLSIPVLGLLVYGACWASLVGFRSRSDAGWHAGASAVYFLGVGFVCLVALVVAVVLLLS
jgi:hypothetical protein